MLTELRPNKMKYLSSTAVNSSYHGLSHGGLAHVDLSTIDFGSFSDDEGEIYTQAGADVLLDYADPATAPTANPRKRKRLWFAPDGAGHEEGEHVPIKRVREPSKKAREAMIPSPDPEAPNIPKRRATRANAGRKRATSSRAQSRDHTLAPPMSPIIRGESPGKGLSMMSGGLQTDNAINPGSTNAILPTIAEEPILEDVSTSLKERNESESSGGTEQQSKDSASTTVTSDVAGSSSQGSIPTSTTSSNQTLTATSVGCVSGRGPNKGGKASTPDVSGRVTKKRRISSASTAPQTSSGCASEGKKTPPPGMKYNSRGQLVDAKKSASMTTTWVIRRKKGTSGQSGGKPKKETVEKNKAKGVDYGNAGDFHKS